MRTRRRSSSDPTSPTRTLDSVIDATSYIQRPTMVLLLRGIPAASGILGMTFLAPKIQDFACATTPNNTDVYRVAERVQGNLTLDPRCHISADETCVQWNFDASNFGTTVKSEFNTVCEWEWIINFSDSLTMVGMMLGGFIFSHVSDWYGRKTAHLGSVLLTLFGALAMAAAPSVAVFVIWRTVMAMGLGGVQIGSTTLAIEALSPTKRVAAPFFCSCGWILGVVLLPIGPWFYRKSWRYLQLFFSLANIPSLIMTILTDESPRWLLATGRKEQARPVIKRLLKRNGMPHSDEDVEEVIDSTPIVEAKRSKADIRDLFVNRAVTLTTISFFIQFPISIFVYYDMMFFVVNDGENPWINVVYTGLFEIPCLFLTAILVKYGRRRLLYLILYTVSGISAGALFFTDKDQGTMRAILGTISKTGVQLLFIVLSVHVNECYITRKRGVALGICTTLSRLGAIIAPTLKSLDTTFHAFSNAGICLMGLAAAIPLKETFNEPLPDTEDEGAS